MSGHITPRPGSPDYNAQLVVYHRDIRPQQFAGILICSVAATIAVALRLYSQWVYRKQWALHDFLIVVALVIVFAQVVASILSLVHGAGLHQVRVLLEDRKPPHSLLWIYTNYWIVSVLWAPAIMCIKLSILIVYQKIFLVHQRWFKIALWINGVYASGLGIAATFIFIFQCWPVDYYWTRFVAYYGDSPPKGTCLPQLAHLVTPQILSTVSDIVILLLPVPIIMGLRVQTSRKIALFFVFLLGAFTVGCGIARISVIFHVSNVADVTWNNINTVTFTVVECSVGIFCACMPLLAPLYTAVLRRYLGSHYSETPIATGSNQIPEAQKSNGFIRQKKLDPAESIDLEFQHLVSGTKTQAWSRGTEPESGSRSQLQPVDNKIRIDRKVEWSSTDISGNASKI